MFIFQKKDMSLWNSQHQVSDDIEEYRCFLFKVDKISSTIFPVLCLGVISYYLLQDPLILLFLLMIIPLFTFSVLKVNKANFFLHKTIHFIGVYLAIVFSSLYFEFLRYEYLIFIPLIITIYICYPYQNRRINRAILMTYAGTWLLLWVYEKWHFDSTYFTADKDIYWFNEVFGVFIIYISMTVIFLAVKLLNKIIEKAKDTTLRLREREAMLNTVLDSSPIGIYAWDLDYNVLAINKQCKQDFKQYELDIVEGDNIKDKVDKDLFEKWDKEYYQKIFSGNSFMKDGYFHEMDEEKRQYVQNYYSPVKDDQGEIIGGIELSLDMTELDKKERALKRSEALLRHIFNSSTDGIEIITLDDTGNATDIERNLKYKEIFKKRKNNKEAKGIMDVTPIYQKNGRKSTEMMADYKAIFKKHRRVAHDWQIYDDDGNIMELEISVFAAEVNDMDCIVGIFRDVTEKKGQETIIEQQLEDLNDKNIELQKYIDSNMQLENFAYIASHDLQGPIRTIVSFTQLLERSLANRINEDEKDYVEFIISATKNMQHLIQDLLLFSRANTSDLKVATFDPRLLIEEVKGELRSNIDEKQAVIKVDDIPSLVHADRQKIKQVFQNLIANALKFTPTDRMPSIHISCKEDQAQWQFSVKDNGIGIEEAYKEKIFMLFKRLHTPKEYEGTGIGLALCKKIVERHGGTIHVASKLGEGSTFTFSISKTLDEAQNSSY